MVPINPRTFEVMATWDVPTGSEDEGVVCDADIFTDAMGVERFGYSCEIEETGTPEWRITLAPIGASE